MNLESVLFEHETWKHKFRVAVTMRPILDSINSEKLKENMFDVARVASDTNCNFGKWLYSEGKKYFDTLEEYNDCVNYHSMFHAEVAKAAQAINSKKFDEAKNMIEDDTPYANASNAIVALIEKMMHKTEYKL